ncbi:PREDICTED: uncharacterized protein LOC108767079, partial [Trachymyrmex cornetzi]|uniref:uncharacterized protein LOC108767079 n=1 Tax=Trachymyrmex cornetzi TaxID=471704 RepID=UPI00084F5D43
MDQTVVPIIKLNGENWIVWKFQTSVILKGRGLYDIVEGQKPRSSVVQEQEDWDKRDAKAQEILQRFFMPEFGESVSTYISQLEEIRNKLKQAGHTAKQYKKNENSKMNMRNCIHCKKLGHASENCWFRKTKENEKDKEIKQDKETENKSKVNAFIGDNRSSNSKDWFMDTGASEHMCNDKKMFQIFCERQEIKKIKIDNRTLLDVKGKSTVVLYAWTGSDFIKTFLSDALYVPDLKFNLFSVGHAMDKGYQLITNSKYCEFVDRE